MKIRFLIAFLAVASAALAGDSGFDRVVKAIETNYGVRRMHIPFMGVANFVVKVARPAGTSSFKLAVFEHLEAGDDADLDSLLRGVSIKDLQPMVRVRSRSKGESTYIYVGQPGKWTRIVIASFERNEAAVIEVKVNPETLRRTLDQPGLARRSFYPATSSNR